MTKFPTTYWKLANIPARAKAFVMTETDMTETDMTNRPKTDQLVAFLGPRGSGKTCEAAAEARRFCWHHKARSEQPVRPHAALYAKTMTFFMDVRRTYQKGSTETEQDVITRYREPRLLILDEIHERGESDFENRLLTHLIDCRYDDMRATILIGNIEPSQLSEHVGPSIASRMEETGGIREFTGNFRKKS